MKTIRHLAEWIWRQLENLHLLVWLTELVGWQKIVISVFVALLLAAKAISEHLSLSLIILIGFVSFTAVLVVIDVMLRLGDRLSRPNVPVHPPSDGSDALKVNAGEAEKFAEDTRSSVRRSSDGADTQEINADEAEEMLEGILTLDTRTWRKRVPFPQPFLRTPEVFLWRDDEGASAEPSIDEVKLDYFTVSTNRSDLTGQWHWRARGVLSRIKRTIT